MSRARLCQPRETLVPALLDLLARRPELRDVGIAGYLVGAAVDGAPGKPTKPPMRAGLVSGGAAKWVAAA
jgi:hypothetical protein